jgi:hypothetical protein
MASPPPAYNYSINAASANSAKNMFAPSKADNVGPCARGTASNFVVASQSPGANGVPLTPAVFQYGAGLYLITADGNGNNDLQTFGIINFDASGNLAPCQGCFAQNTSPTGTVASTVATIPYQVLYLGTGTIPTLFQNTGSSITYSVSAIKIANI